MQFRHGLARPARTPRRKKRLENGCNDVDGSDEVDKKRLENRSDDVQDQTTCKTTMGIEMLRSKRPDTVRKEVAMHLLAYYLI